VGTRYAVIVFSLIVIAGCVITGCVRSEARSCGDKLCPKGQACARGACVDQSIVFACSRLAEGASCTMPEIGTGVCETGLCRIGSCGDGVIDPLEACDGAALGGKTCLDFRSTGSAGLSCASDCSFDISRCTASCGDGKKNTAEQCDGMDFGQKTCITHGFYSGSLVCTENCEVNTGGCIGMCGDGIRNGFEPCDGNDFGTDSCMARGFLGEVTPMLCTSACSFDPTSCTCGGELCAKTTQRCVKADGIYTCMAL
jgi:hypothetical protein